MGSNVKFLSDVETFGNVLVGNNAMVKAGAKLDRSELENDVIVGSDAIITGSRIGARSKIGLRANITNCVLNEGGLVLNNVRLTKTYAAPQVHFYSGVVDLDSTFRRFTIVISAPTLKELIQYLRPHQSEYVNRHKTIYCPLSLTISLRVLTDSKNGKKDLEQYQDHNCKFFR